MRNNKKAFTLVEMLVALAVSSIIIAATYASYELIQKQYKRNIDIAEMHNSGRSIMQVLEREIRMAGYEFRDANGTMTYGSIVGGLAITDSGDACCDEVTLIYDDVEDVVNAKGEVTSSTVDRIKIRFWTEAYSSNKGDRFRLYKRKTILGRNNAILGSPIIGAKEVMADYIDDLQIINIVESGLLYSGFEGSSGITSVDPVEKKFTGNWGSDRISALAFGADGSLYSAQDNNNFILIHDLKTKKVTGDININIRTSALAVGSNGLIYSGVEGVNSGVTVIDPVTKSVTKNFGGGQISALAFGPDGLLYSAHEANNSIQIYNVVTKKNIGGINATKRISALTTKINKTGAEALVSINLTLRAKNEYGRISKDFLKKDYFSGNFNFKKNDLFKRDTFSTAVSVRNM